jgi:hypothetical protein
MFNIMQFLKRRFSKSSKQQSNSSDDLPLDELSQVIGGFEPMLSPPPPGDIYDDEPLPPPQTPPPPPPETPGPMPGGMTPPLMGP